MKNLARSAKELSRYEKVAVILLALGEDLASTIVQRMNADEIQQVARAMGTLRTVPQSLVDEVMGDLHEIMIDGPSDRSV